MIVGRPAPKSNFSLLKNLVCDRGWGLYSAFFWSSVEWRIRKCPCLYTSSWPHPNPAWFWHTSMPTIRRHWVAQVWVSFDECIWDFSSFARIWYWPYLSLCFVSLLQYFFISVADSDQQHLVMPLHMSCPLACPPSAQESPLVAVPDKTSPLRVFHLCFKSKEDSSWNEGVFPNLCCILVLATVPAMQLSLSGSPSPALGWKGCQCPREVCEPHRIMLVSTASEEPGTVKANKSLAAIGPWYMAFASERENPSYFIEGKLLLLLYYTFLFLIKLNNFT